VETPKRIDGRACLGGGKFGIKRAHNFVRYQSSAFTSLHQPSASNMNVKLVVVFICTCVVLIPVVAGWAGFLRGLGQKLAPNGAKAAAKAVGKTVW